MVEELSTVGDAIGSRPETFEPARWREANAASLGLVVLVWGICGDDAGDADSLGGGLAC